MVSLPWDLVYLLGTGSRWQNNELRYSLRSVEKHLPPARIWILGERPGWLRGVEHIHCRDRFGAKPQTGKTGPEVTVFADGWKLLGAYIGTSDYTGAIFPACLNEANTTGCAGPSP